MHRVNSDIEALSASIWAYAMDRLRMDPPTIDHPLPQATLEKRTEILLDTKLARLFRLS